MSIWPTTYASWIALIVAVVSIVEALRALGYESKRLRDMPPLPHGTLAAKGETFPLPDRLSEPPEDPYERELREFDARLREPRPSEP